MPAPVFGDVVTITGFGSGNTANTITTLHYVVHVPFDNVNTITEV
jgi:hypothetical protein